MEKAAGSQLSLSPAGIFCLSQPLTGPSALLLTRGTCLSLRVGHSVAVSELPSCVTVATNSSALPRLRENPVPVRAESAALLPQPLAVPGLPPFPVDLPILDLSRRVWNRTVCGLSQQASDAQRDGLEFPPRRSMRPAAPTCLGGAFHCMLALRSVCPLISSWTLGLCSRFGRCE